MGRPNVGAAPGARKRYVVLVAIPAIGHVGPLLKQAEELARRGHRVAIASGEEARSWSERAAPGVAFISAGPCGAEALQNEIQAASARSSFVLGTMALASKVLYGVWEAMYDGLLGALRDDPPDAMVIDLATLAGFDVADALGVPYVVNNADVLPTLPPDLFPAADYVPWPFSTTPILDMGPAHRLVSGVFRRIMGSSILLQGRRINALRASRGLPSADVGGRLRDKLILTTSAFGVEYCRALPPLVQMVGPMIDGTIDPLPAEYQRWMEDGPPVVYVSMGTAATLSERQVRAMTTAFGAGAAFRVLWKIDPAARRFLPASLPSNLRVEAWVPSQTAILAHPRTRAFVSHCGVNSAYESLYFGTPIVGIPMFGDQRDMAYRVQDAGAGLVLDKQRFTSEDLLESILRVMREPRFEESLARIQASIRLAGGIPRAADLIEHFMEFGIAHYATGDRLRAAQSRAA